MTRRYEKVEITLKCRSLETYSLPGTLTAPRHLLYNLSELHVDFLLQDSKCTKYRVLITHWVKDKTKIAFFV